MDSNSPKNMAKDNLPLVITSPGVPKSLLTIPVKILQKILDFCDYPAIQSLLKSDPTLRRFILSNPPKFQISIVEITVDDRKVDLNTVIGGQSLGISYVKDGKENVNISSKFSTFKGVKSKILENSDFQDVFADDFKSLLEFQNGKIEVLDFSKTTDSGDIFQKLAGNQIQIRAKELKMKTNNSSDEILKTLSLLNPENLNILNLEQSEAELEDTPIFVGLNKGENVFQSLEQWQNLEELNAPDFQFSFEIEDYLHLKKVRAQFLYMNMEHMMRLKETFLHSGPPKHFRFTYQLLQDHQNFPDNFGPFLRNEEDLTASWFYRTPRLSVDQILMIKVFEMEIEFKFIDGSDVPEGGIVQDVE